MNKHCPECGCPITNETVCPECGHAFAHNETPSPRPFRNKIERLYRKYFYTEDADPYVDLAAKLFSVPKVVTVVLFLLWLLFYFFFVIVLPIVGLGGTFGPKFMLHFVMDSGALGVGVVSVLLYLMFMSMIYGAVFLFWWWVGDIVVNGIRKIRQSKNK